MTLAGRVERARAASRHPEAQARGKKLARTVGITAPAQTVRARPWAARLPGIRGARTDDRRRLVRKSRLTRVNAGQRHTTRIEGRRSVKPSAQPTWVRTQHLPHVSAGQSR